MSEHHLSAVPDREFPEIECGPITFPEGFLDGVRRFYRQELAEFGPEPIRVFNRKADIWRWWEEFNANVDEPGWWGKIGSLPADTPAAVNGHFVSVGVLNSDGLVDAFVGVAEIVRLSGLGLNKDTQYLHCGIKYFDSAWEKDGPEGAVPGPGTIVPVIYQGVVVMVIVCPFMRKGPDILSIDVDEEDEDGNRSGNHSG